MNKEAALRDKLRKIEALFAGAATAGEKTAAGAAAIYSLIETCKLAGINPFAYLRDLLARIADHPINLIDELLP